MLLPTAVIFSNNIWTFWDVFVLFFVVMPLIMMWFFAIFDVFRRPDLSGWGRVGWLLGIIIFPWLGTLAYLIFRPREAEAYYGGSGGYGYRGAGYGAAGYAYPPPGVSEVPISAAPDPAP